jgi:hypothetical protein
MLSAVAPDKMLLVLQNVKNILKVSILYNTLIVHFYEVVLMTLTETYLLYQPGGRVLFRDYAFGDLAQV